LIAAYQKANRGQAHFPRSPPAWNKHQAWFSCFFFLNPANAARPVPSRNQAGRVQRA
jgi:hypothetical protein